MITAIVNSFRAGQRWREDYIILRPLISIQRSAVESQDFSSHIPWVALNILLENKGRTDAEVTSIKLNLYTRNTAAKKVKTKYQAPTLTLELLPDKHLRVKRKNSVQVTVTNTEISELALAQRKSLQFMQNSSLIFSKIVCAISSDMDNTPICINASPDCFENIYHLFKKASDAMPDSYF
ncbi:hypothetical protein QP940_02495 [Corynebacterium pseudodiphtheriticum]|uniref:hypothetical protein n=1 Tax=Corynebacterium pseudodiphtheriticum TaxID=37637 RepID=UPI00254FFDF2|nr:hypothetical protein [Corynebacterium pseudodiphtheriticum]MDK8737371.1 hypothetical protein [Corynebacterium pseudodiphtheriticum]MDK8744136.1 hypothetical protein [Corynebacterium pseudodiphtheriticum]